MKMACLAYNLFCLFLLVFPLGSISAEEGEKDSVKKIQFHENLAKKEPKNSENLFSLAKLYDSQNNSALAIYYYKKALILEPNRLDILNKLAYRYLEDKEIILSFQAFQSILQKNPKNIEALIGMGLIEIQNKNLNQAEIYFKKVLLINSKHISAYFNLAEIKILKGQFFDAENLYKIILSIDSKNEKAKKSLSQLGEKKDLWDANVLLKQNNIWEAIKIYEKLICLYPENIDTYLLLGNSYMRLECFNNAIEVYQLALEKKPCNSEIRSALSYAFLRRGTYSPVLWSHYQWFIYYPYLFYFVKEDIYPRIDWDDVRISQQLFCEVLWDKPNHPDALAGIGRIEALKDNKEIALEYLDEALEEQPENTTALATKAALYASMGKYFSARDTYLDLLEIEPDDESIYQDYIDVVNNSDPIYNLTGFYTEENEQDFITANRKEWVARLKNYGGSFSWSFAVQDCLKLFGGVDDEYILLKNLLNKTNIYSLDIQRAELGISWKYGPYISLLGGCGFSAYSQDKKSNFFTKKGWYTQPFFNVTYTRNYHKLLVETIADAPIVARDFSNNRSALINRQFLRGLYEYNFGNRTIFGATAANIWYINPIKRNQQQLASSWIQIGPPKYWQNVVLRYQFIYGRFNHLTSDYYTYRFQTTHWINLIFSKNWWCNQLITEAGIGHAWQRSFEQGQIIVVNPITAFHTIHREINAAYARMEFRPTDCMQLAITATYTLDSFNYTTAAITGKFSWRF